MALVSQQVPSVDRRDYRVRITGVASEMTEETLKKCGAYDTHQDNRLKVRHFKSSSIIHFFATCDPHFVEKVSDALMAAICPRINDGLLEAFEPEQLQAIA